MTSADTHPHAVESLQAELRALNGRLAEQTRQLRRVSAGLARSQERLAGQHQLQTIIDTIPTLAWSANADGRAEFFSQRWRDYTGLSQEEASGWKWKVTIHPDDLETLGRQWLQIMAARKPAEVEARMRASDGTYRWFLFRAAPVIDGNGEVVKWFGTSTDIEMRNRAGMALQLRERELRLIVDRIPGMVAVADAQGRHEYANKRARDFVGRELHEVTGPGWVDLIHPDERARFCQEWQACVAARRPMDLVHRLRRHDGAYRLMRALVEPVFAAEGQVVKWYGILTDIEALRAAERVASGQLEVLKQTLNALTTEPQLDRLLELVLRKIGDEMAATRVRVWKWSATGELTLFATFEEDEVFYPAKGLPVDHVVSMQTRHHPVWRAAFGTGTDSVLADLDQTPPRIRLAGPGESPWFPWSPEASEAASAQGAIGTPDKLSVPLLLEGKPAGIIGIQFAAEPRLEPAELELVRALAHQAMFAIRLMQLSRQSREAAVTAERNRLARDIHDTLAQGLTGVIVQLEAAEDAQSSRGPTEAMTHVANARELARTSLQEARRSVHALRPQALTDQDLCSALKEMIGKMTAGTPVAGDFTVRGPEQMLPEHVEETVLRVSQEVLTNAVRHARATRFTAALTYAETNIRLEFRDDGSGFDVASQPPGFGLLGIKERVDALGGEIRMESDAAGTRVLVTLPSTEVAPPAAP